jgi:ribose transport system permease protein
LRGLKFPNGICIASDRQSLLFAETWGCTVKRYWFAGAKAGDVELVLDNLPGYPDNINLASDGNYWLAMMGMRCPALDLAWRMPSFRRRMAKRLPVDEWLFPNINSGCVIKFDEAGRVLESLWDLGGVNCPMITSMREHRGSLYLGGIMNNRIGRYPLPKADPTFVQYDVRWGKKQ